MLLPQVNEPLRTGSSSILEAPQSTTTTCVSLGTEEEFHDTTTTTSGLHPSRWHRYKKLLQWKPKLSLPNKEMEDDKDDQRRDESK